MITCLNLSKMMFYFQAFDLGPNIPVDEKLIKAVPLSDSLLSKGICVKYVATVGGKWPTPQVEIYYYVF